VETGEARADLAPTDLEPEPTKAPALVMWWRAAERPQAVRRFIVLFPLAPPVLTRFLLWPQEQKSA
jgi:hypothetical protein